MKTSSSAWSIVPSGLPSQDVERAVARDGTLVGAVGRGQRIVDVGDRHDARLHGDLDARDAIRIAVAR